MTDSPGHGAEARPFEHLLVIRHLMGGSRAVFASAALATLMLAFFRFNPLQLTWVHIFERLGLYLYWPLVLLAASLFFLLFSEHHYRRKGLPMYFPFLASVTAALLVGTAVLLIGEWSAHWSVLWCVASLPVIALACMAVARAFISYTELWRIFFNRRVVETVEKALEDGQFASQTQSRLRRKRQSPSAREWGSPHALAVARGIYEERKYHVFHDDGDGGAVKAALRRYLESCRILTDYYSLDWADAILPEIERRWRIAELLREMITVTLWRLENAPPSQDGEAWRNGVREIAASINGGIDAWRKALVTTLGPGEAPYTSLLERIFDTPSLREAPSPALLRGIVQETVALFDSLPAEDVQVGGTCVRRREICANAWITFAPHSLPGQVCFDIWLSVRPQRREEKFIRLDGGDSLEPSQVLGYRMLARLYGKWSGSVPEEWASGLRGRQDYLASIETRPPFERLPLHDRARGVHSWPYSYVWKVFPVHVIEKACACILLLALAISMIAANPRLPGNWGLNVVAHISDPRLFHDFARNGLTSAAGFDDSRWLALGTVKGLAMLNKESHVPREGVVEGQILDVTEGIARDSFIALGGNQSITLVSPPLTGMGPFVTHEWLPPPANPCWSVAGFDEGLIAANELEQDGWLVAVRGWGVARYLFGHDAYGRRFRKRSWQTGGLSCLAIEKASLTRSGVWVTLSAGGIRYADRATLREAPGRAVQTPPIAQLDTQYDDHWASAVDDRKGVWLFSPGKENRRTAAPGMWHGPYFGDTSAEGALLCDGGDVKAAALEEPVAWLGTGYGLFWYDMDRRHMSHAAPNDVGIIAALGGGEAPQGGRRAWQGERQALAAGRTGLIYVSVPLDGADRQPTVRTLNPGAVTSISVSPDEKSCVFQLSPPEGGYGREVSACAAPFGLSPSTVVISGEGWSSPSPQPRITGIAPMGGHLLFTTDGGAFLYGTETRTYRDLSASGLDDGAPTRQLGEITMLTPGAGCVAALADGVPHLASLGEKGQPPSSWECLDGDGRTKPVRLALAGRTLFGVDREGRMFQYRGKGSRPELFFAGKAPSLVGGASSVQGAVGDVSASAGKWSLAFLSGRHVISYFSHLGKIRERALPAHVGEGAIRQLRMTNGITLLLTDAGEVFDLDGRSLFSAGAFPFAPEATSAMTPAGEDGAVIVGGPSGAVAEYRWPTASWRPVGGGALPVDGDGGSVVNVQRTSSAGIFAQTASGEVFHTRGGRWEKIAGCRRWAAGSAGSVVWSLQDEGIVRLSETSSGSPSSWLARPCSSESGMGAFVAAAKFLWKLDETTLAFFGGDGAIGRYSSVSDRWEQSSDTGLKRPRGFASTPEAAFALDGKALRRISRELVAEPFFRLPAGSAGAEIFSDGSSLSLAWISKGAVVLRVWADPSDRRSGVEHRGDGSLFGGKKPPAGRPLAFSGEGKLFALRDGRYVCLRPADGKLELDESADGAKVLEEVSNPARRALAELDLRGASLEWFLEPGGGITAAWKSGDAPVWGSDRDRLAVSCIREIAIAPSGELLVATEGGVLARDGDTYALKSTWPALRDARFFSAFGQSRLFVRNGAEASLEWKDGGLVPAAAPAAHVCRTGMWVWTLPLQAAGWGGLSITRESDGAARRQVATASTGKFADDVVTWMGRVSESGDVAFRTENGAWLFDARAGRSAAFEPKKFLPEAFTFRNPVLELDYAAGRVTLTARDGGSLFEGGRFFFDNCRQICGIDERLLTIVPGRGAMVRNPGSPMEVTHFSRLPAELSEGARLELRTVGGTHIVVAVPARGGKALSWAPVVSRDGLAWKTSDLHTKRNEFRDGIVTWARASAGEGFLPTLRFHGGHEKTLRSWWSERRFAWDDVSGSGALNGGVAVVLTPLGALSLARSEGGAWRAKDLLPIPGARYLDPGRHGGQRESLVVSGEGMASRVLLTATPDGALITSPGGPGGPVRARTTVTLEEIADPSGGSVIGLVQRLSPYDPANEPVGGAFESTAPGFPTHRVIQKGQFAFDRARGVCPAKSRSADMWLTWQDNREAGGSPWMFLNQAKVQPSGRTRLLLRGAWRSPYTITLARAAPDGAVFALVQGSPPSFKRLHFSDAGGVAWGRADVRAAFQAFRTGERVEFSVPDLRWLSREPTYPWSEAPAFTTSPYEYRIFSRSGRDVSLAFDTMTSIVLLQSAADGGPPRMIVGTKGGVFSAPFRNNGLCLLASDEPQLIFSYNNDATPEDWVIDVERVRKDMSGNLLVRYGKQGRVALLRVVEGGDGDSGRGFMKFDQLVSIGWPDETFDMARRKISLRIGGNSFSDSGGKMYVAGNDIFGSWERMIRDITDYACDRQAGAFWLCTKETGVFKVLPEKLR